jgi:hypothetical protein
VFLDHGPHCPIENEDLFLNNIFKFLFQFAIILVYKAFYYKIRFFPLYFLPQTPQMGGF